MSQALDQLLKDIPIVDQTPVDPPSGSVGAAFYKNGTVKRLCLFFLGEWTSWDTIGPDGLDNFVTKDGDEEISGEKTFTVLPVLPASSPTSDNHPTRRKYVLDAINNAVSGFYDTIADALSNYLAKDNTTEFTPTDDYHPATKKFVIDEIASSIGSATFYYATASNDLQLSSDDEVTITQNGEPKTLAKRDTMLISGSVRVTFDIRNTDINGLTYDLKVNGTVVANGSRPSNDTTWGSKSHDVDVKPGEKIELYVQSGAGSAKVRNFRISFIKNTTANGGVVNI